MLGNPKYPNLELMEYQFKQLLFENKEWRRKAADIKKQKKHSYLDFDVTVFSQVWGSTNTGFDICEDGMAAVGGCAMTKAYTVVIKECTTETYGIFINDRLCYMVNNANDEFYKDLAERNMKSISQAKKRYQEHLNYF